MTHVRHRVLALAFLITLGSDLAPAQAELPSEMLSGYSFEHKFTEQMHLPGQGPGEFITADLLVLNRDESAVEIRWRFQDAGAAHRSKDQRVDLSFAPTAIARRAGTSDRCYIVGWSARTASVIVEQWVFEEYALGSAVPVGGTVPVSFLILPEIRREIIFVSSALAPVWDAACTPYGDRLGLLTSGLQPALHFLDLSAGAVDVVYPAEDATGPHRTVVAGLHTVHGFVMYTQRRLPWGSVVSYSEPYSVFVYVDEDLDGEWDGPPTLQSFSDFTTTFAPGAWDMEYGG